MNHNRVVLNELPPPDSEADRLIRDIFGTVEFVVVCYMASNVRMSLRGFLFENPDRQGIHTFQCVDERLALSFLSRYANGPFTMHAINWPASVPLILA